MTRIIPILMSATLVALASATALADGLAHLEGKPFLAAHRTTNFDPATGDVTKRRDVVFARRADGSVSLSIKAPSDVIGYRRLQLAEHGFQPITIDPLVNVVYRGGLTREEADQVRAEMAAAGKPIKPEARGEKREPLPPCEEFFGGAVCSPIEPIYGKRALRVDRTFPGRGDDVIREELIVLADYAFYTISKKGWVNEVLIIEQTTESFITGDPPDYLFAVPDNVDQTTDELDFMLQQAIARGKTELADCLRREHRAKADAQSAK